MKNNIKKQTKDYTESERIDLVRKLLPPENKTPLQLSQESGISKTTLHEWKKRYEVELGEKTTQTTSSKKYNSREKFLAVMETYTMTELQLSQYCRSKGIYVEDIKKWRESCLDANNDNKSNSVDIKNELMEEKKRSKNLEKDLDRKTKALAETAALLVLSKKLGAILGETEEE